MSQCRILAIDLRSQLFGFAVLEGPGMLLDFGRKPCRITATRNTPMTVQKKTADLLTLFVPSTIVLKSEWGRRKQASSERKESIEAIKQEAAMRSVQMYFLNRRDIHRVFRQSGNISKYKIAGLIAEMFPELAWKLPPNRKNWQPEHHNMAIFDAVSLGLTYYAQQDNTVSIHSGDAKAESTG
jgi:hypothetical protein